MDFCLDLIKEIRQYSELEAEFVEFYNNLKNKVEDFMCSLLDQVYIPIFANVWLYYKPR